MERLTEWVGDGADRKAIARQDRRDIGDKDCVTRLAAYEDTGLTPNDIETMRNELCLKCGHYKDAHLGACDGCRWRKEVN